METKERPDDVFDWNELRDIFHIQESEVSDEGQRRKILDKINAIADEYGRDYVLRKIALTGE